MDACLVKKSPEAFNSEKDNNFGRLYLLFHLICGFYHSEKTCKWSEVAGVWKFFGCGRKWPEVVGLDKACSGVGGRGRKFLNVVGVGRKSSEATALGAITDHYRALNCNSYLLCERRIHSD